MYNKKAFIIIVTICCVMTLSSFGQQFQQIFATGVWETQPLVNRIGIGTFGAAASVQSALHIDGNLLNTPIGEVFRTDAPNIATYWRMFRGGTQFGMLYNNNDNDFRLEATQRDFLIEAMGVSNNAAMAQRFRVTSGTGLGYGLGGAVVNLDNVTETVIERAGGFPLMRWPRAMLNIGTDLGIALQAQGGWRNWMDVGTFPPLVLVCRAACVCETRMSALATTTAFAPLLVLRNSL